jgi:diguanylate cyclase (GGDEF)-like protein
MPKSKHIAITGAVCLTSISKVLDQSSSNLFNGTTEHKLGGDGISIAKHVALENTNVELLTALKPDSMLRQMMRDVLKESSFKVKIDPNTSLNDSTENIIIESGRNILHIKNNTLNEHLFDFEKLDMHISNANLLVISTEVSTQSFSDAIRLANKYDIPIFILMSTGSALNYNELLDFDFDYLFLSHIDAIHLLEDSQLESFDEISKNLNSQLIINNRDDGITIADPEMVFEVDIECIVHNDTCVHVHFHFISYMAHLINTGENVKEAVLIAVEEIEDYMSKHKTNPQTQQRSLEESFLNMQAEAYQDSLSKCLNRMGLQQRLNNLDFARNNYFVAILDIDNFKQVNDNYGHPVGDEMIAYLGKCLKSSLRPTDLVARWGGEEFVIIFTANGEDKYQLAQSVLERVRLKINETCHESLNGKQISVSIGTNNLTKSSKFQEELDYADQALYKAKKDGKNCIKFAQSR